MEGSLACDSVAECCAFTSWENEDAQEKQIDKRKISPLLVSNGIIS